MLLNTVFVTTAAAVGTRTERPLGATSHVCAVSQRILLCRPQFVGRFSCAFFPFLLSHDFLRFNNPSSTRFRVLSAVLAMAISVESQVVELIRLAICRPL